MPGNLYRALAARPLRLAILGLLSGIVLLGALCRTAPAAAQTLPPYAGDIPLDLKDSADYRTVIYVDPSTTTPGDGSSPSSPLASWTEVSFEANAAYVQKRGTTDSIMTTISVNQPGVLLGAYGDEADPRPIIYADVDTSTGNKYVLNVMYDNTTVRDLEVVSPQATSAIHVTNWTHQPEGCVVWNCSFHGVDQTHYLGWGVRIFAPTTKILNSEIYYTGDDGIFIQDAPMVEIGYNTITRVNQKWFEDPSEQHAGGDGVQYDSDINGFYIHHNVVDRSDTGNKFCFITGTDQQNVFGLIENNVCTVAKGRVPVYASQYAGESKDFRIVVRNNFFRYVDTDGEGIGVYNHAAYPEIYNNIFIGFRQGVALVSPTALANIHHNVFYNMGDSAVWNSRPMIAYNNIFALDEQTPAFSYTSNVTASHNLFPFASQVVGDHAVVGDPGFVDAAHDNFRLMETSPAINNGTPAAGVAADADGVVRDSLPDIGAYEFQPALDLTVRSACDGVHLAWTVNVTLPVTSTWRIRYRLLDSTLVLVATETLSNAARSYLLTGLVAGQAYAVTLDAVLADGTVWLSDTVQVTPLDVCVYLPLVLWNVSD
ncbi:MAG: right-handed parallel beta-helix repeat-containing protein [Anaerolineae bacterium]|nr:right-handed parallel beta-helix repeat-containing protein [Anaerolineae bacterium]